MEKSASTEKKLSQNQLWGGSGGQGKESWGKYLILALGPKTMGFGYFDPWCLPTPTDSSAISLF